MSATATILSLPRPAEPAPVPAEAERNALRSAIEAVDAAAADAERAAEPVRRLESAVRAADEAAAELDRLRQHDQGRVAAWIAAGCEGPRPEPSPETLAAERRLSLSAGDAAAARTMLPDLSARLTIANQRLAAAGEARRGAAYLAAAAICRERCAELRNAIIGVLRVEGKLRAVGDELQRVGNHHPGDSGNIALNGAAAIKQAVLDCRRETTLPADPVTGAALLQRLMVDAGADFGE